MSHGSPFCQVSATSSSMSPCAFPFAVTYLPSRHISGGIPIPGILTALDGTSCLTDPLFPGK